MKELTEKKIKLYTSKVKPETFAGQVRRILVMPAALSNVTLRTDDEASDGIMLSEPELEVLMEAVLASLSGLVKVPTYGSLVLYAQEGSIGQWGESACCLEADLRNGPADLPGWALKSGTSSRVTVGGAIKSIVKRELYRQLGAKPEFLVSWLVEASDVLESRIYYNAEQPILVFNTDLGRYVAGYRDSTLNNMATWLLAMIAQLLASMRPDDVVSQESAEQVKNALLGDDYKSRKMMEAVEQMFARDESILRELRKRQR